MVGSLGGGSGRVGMKDEEYPYADWKSMNVMLRINFTHVAGQIVSG